LDGVQARILKISNFNNGNVPYELLIRSNTIISNLGKYEPSLMLNKPIPVKLSEVLNTSGYISKLLSLFTHTHARTHVRTHARTHAFY